MMQLRCLRIWCLFFISISCLLPELTASGSIAQAQSARAQSTTAEPAGYRVFVEEARKEYERSNYAEARALFTKANALFPNAKALRGLAMSEFELRNYSDCVATLERALASQVRPLEGELRAETQRLLERARSFVARVKVAVEPGAAVVVVDGVPMQLGPQGNLVLEVGNHVLEFRAEGYAPEKRVMKVIGGEEEDLRVVLPKDGVQPSPLSSTPAPLSAAPTAHKPLYKNPWLWGGVGVVTAAAVTGLAIGLSHDGGGTRPVPINNAAASGSIR